MYTHHQMKFIDLEDYIDPDTKTMSTIFPTKLNGGFSTNAVDYDPNDYIEEGGDGVLSSRPIDTYQNRPFQCITTDYIVLAYLMTKRLQCRYFRILVYLQNT
jgi:hypothetical protein